MERLCKVEPEQVASRPPVHDFADMMTPAQSLSHVLELFQEHFGTVAQSRAFAPGRVEVIGNHTDYNGGTIVGTAIDRGIAVAARVRPDGKLRFYSDTKSSDGIVETSRATFAQDDIPTWCQYPLGIIDEAHLRGWPSEPVGLDLTIASDLPEGTGLASSAALEMAVVGALSQLLFTADMQPSRGALVEVAHRAENRFVGMPCGLLDQTVVGFGKKNGLVVLDAAINKSVSIPLPAGIRFVLFRSHISHALVDSPYEDRHRECRTALMGLERFVPGIRHLARLHPADLDAYASVLETRPAMRARHVVHEQRRVGAFLAALSQNDLVAAGACMTASHESSRALFDNSTPELDTLVATANAQPGVLGARLSGGGWGGSMVAMVTDEFEEKHGESICDQYEELFEVRPHWWQSSAAAGMVSERL